MTWVLALLTVWAVVAALVAVALGRVATRGDSEELGSVLNWDLMLIPRMDPETL